MTARTCALTGEEFEISGIEQDYCRKFNIPLPTLAPHERLRNVLVFRNRVYLYPSQCALTGKKMLSCYPPESTLKSCEPEFLHSDKIDNCNFGRPYDFTRPFFDQFLDLYRTVYLPALNVIAPENSEYTNGTTGAKNCYLMFSSSYSEDCLFSYGLMRCRSVADCAFAHDSELCYDCADIRNCYDLKWSRHCRNCSESAFLHNCQACSNCYCCANLNHRSFHFMNEPLGEGEYRRRIREIDLGSRAVLQREKVRFDTFSARFPLKHYFGTTNECSTGNYIANNKQCIECQFTANSEDCANSLFVNGAKNSILHASFGNNSELVYNSTTVGENAYSIRFCFECWQNVSDLEYCCNCTSGVANCFGCAGLTRSSYCILNKRYSKEEYRSLTSRIRKQMSESREYGRFFPTSFSPFYYNESDTGVFFPLSRENALAWGFRWKTEPNCADAALKTLPDHIGDLSEEAVGATFGCKETGKPFRLIRQEVQFYRRQHIAPPELAPLQRIRSRMALFEIKSLRTRACTRCSTKIDTVFGTPSREILCESCFEKEVC